MAAELRHRGPDDEGTWADGPVGLCHRRLSIIDVERSRQPMASVDDRLHLTFNGEILNYAALRAQSRYRFRTRGDTEAVLAVHQEQGIAGVHRLRGQFAYGLFDGDDLWLVRDRLGILPLYYYCDDEMFAFASEIKALLPALPRPAEIDTASLDAYLERRAVAAPYTLFKDVRKVRPGHWLRVGPSGRVEETRYWQIPTAGTVAFTDEDAVSTLDKCLNEAVQLALVADVPVGALLSGGVDSSLLVALATQARAGAPIATFSAGFGDSRFDELALADEVSRRFATDHHQVTLDPMEFAALWRDLSWYRDAPISEPADVAVYKLATAARESVRVVLTGEGSDELFAGYPKYRFAALGDRLDRVPARWRAGLRSAAQALPSSAARLRVALRALSSPTEEERLSAWFAPFLTDERAALLDNAVAHAPPDLLIDGIDPVSRMLAYDCQAWLSDNLLERGDRMAMAASVEMRPPFLDHQLVELAFSMPSNLKVRGARQKWILKEVARRYLPDRIVDRRKVGFRVPLDQWFRGHLCDMAWDLLLDRGSFVTTVMDRALITDLLEVHRCGRRDESIRIWTLASLEIWHDAVLGKLSPAHQVDHA
jgi:asparagine synthase (glutamine-hydrolysing)